jgi:hypothetical protein
MHPLNLTVTLGRPARNTSLPTGRQAKPCNAGLIDMEWVIEDLTKSEIQQSWCIVVLRIRKVPPAYRRQATSLFQCPRRVCSRVFLQR